MTTKEKLLKEFEGCLFDFWGEEPTKTKIKEAWYDFLDTVKESEKVPHTINIGKERWYYMRKNIKRIFATITALVIFCTGKT